MLKLKQRVWMDWLTGKSGKPTLMEGRIARVPGTNGSALVRVKMESGEKMVVDRDENRLHTTYQSALKAFRLDLTRRIRELSDILDEYADKS
jgi:hypothetical protein